jgi:hypothetical protein
MGRATGETRKPSAPQPRPDQTVTVCSADRSAENTSSRTSGTAGSQSRAARLQKSQTARAACARSTHPRSIRRNGVLLGRQRTVICHRGSPACTSTFYSRHFAAHGLWALCVDGVLAFRPRPATINGRILAFGQNLSFLDHPPLCSSYGREGC